MLCSWHLSSRLNGLKWQSAMQKYCALINAGFHVLFYKKTLILISIPPKKQNQCSTFESSFETGLLQLKINLGWIQVTFMNQNQNQWLLSPKWVLTQHSFELGTIMVNNVVKSQGIGQGQVTEYLDWHWALSGNLGRTIDGKIVDFLCKTRIFGGYQEKEFFFSPYFYLKSNFFNTHIFQPPYVYIHVIYLFLHVISISFVHGCKPNNT